MSDRTPEEREAARRAREARRAGRYGGGGEERYEEARPFDGSEPAPSPSPRASSSPFRSAPPPAPNPPTAQVFPPSPVGWPTAAQAGTPGGPSGPEDPDEALGPLSRFARPPASGRPRARPRPRRAADGDRGPGTGPDGDGGGQDGGDGRDAGGRPPHRLRTRVLAVGALVLAIAAIWFLIELFQPFTGSGHGSVVVTIPAGASTGSIGDQLAHEGVISSSFFFGLRAALEGDRGKLRAGTYRLKLGMSYGSVLSLLTAGPPAAPTTDVTIIPGRTRHQIALLLHKEGIHGRFLTDTMHTTLLNVQSYGAPRSLDNLEGFLFPSTYQLRTPITIPALVADQLTTFRQQFATVNMAYARSKNLTPYDVLKIASMVEAEAGTAHDRPLIASVIYNRLRLGMALGIDATIRYAVNNYSTPLTDAQLATPSPYNTRTHLGLPPTPIDNPSLASIQAAAHPARTSYVYFVAKPCGNGASAFASTAAQFQLDVTRYNEARAQRGGRSPLKC